MSDISGNGKCIAQAYPATGTLTRTVNMTDVNTGIAGLNTPLPIDNRQPYVVINYIIAVNGIYTMGP